MPTFDTDRVYISDMRKVLNWYNMLLEKGLLDFSETEETAEGDTEEKEAADDQANS